VDSRLKRGDKVSVQLISDKHGPYTIEAAFLRRRNHKDVKLAVVKNKQGEIDEYEEGSII